MPGDVLLVNANALSLPLGSGKVQVIITSPPYFNLRSYAGTAKWVGGDPGCDHWTVARKKNRYDYTLTGSVDQRSNTGSAVVEYKNPCPGCGAVLVDSQLGTESSALDYINNMAAVMDECYRVLRDDGTLWFNISDSYNGSGGEHRDNSGQGGIGIKDRGKVGAGVGQKRDPISKFKELMGFPWRLAFEFQRRGWYLRSEIIWFKDSPMPESVLDRPTRSFEYIFMFSKRKHYFYDSFAVREPNSLGVGSRNLRNVWAINTSKFSGAHFATFPIELPLRCISAGSPDRGCCPACGAPWVRVVQALDEFQFEMLGWRPTCQCYSDPAGCAVPLWSFSRLERRTITIVKEPTAELLELLDVYARLPTRPAIVFDPFNGSATTAAAALQLGRLGVGTDVSFEYLSGVSKMRLGELGVKVKKHTETNLADLPMFSNLV